MKKLSKNVIAECEMPATYYTLDEIASKLKTSPLSLGKGNQNYYKKWIFCQSHIIRSYGFRTDARIDEIEKIFLLA